VHLLFYRNIVTFEAFFTINADLLEHEDLTVGVMTSQILTEVHAIDPMKLEECIQDCPAGSN
jgi:ADP-glucose pyrophosphorylase